MQIQRLTKTFHGIGFLVLVAATAIAVAACQPSAKSPSSDTPSAVAYAPGDCRTVEHMMGETEVCGQPQRIVVFGPLSLESLLALDVQPVGYATHVEFFLGDYTEPAQQIPYLGDRITQPIANLGSIGQPSLEKILQLKPDLIIGAEYTDGAYEILSQIAPTLILDDPDPDENLRAIAQAVDRTEKAEQILAQTEQKIAAAREAFAPLVEANPQILLLFSPQLPNIGVVNSVTLCGSLLEELGFQLVPQPGITVGNPSWSVSISIENLPELNYADLIFLLSVNTNALKESGSMENFEEQQISKVKQTWQENAIAQSLDASKAGKVHFLQGYSCATLPGPIGTDLYLKELQEQLLPPEVHTMSKFLDLAYF